MKSILARSGLVLALAAVLAFGVFGTASAAPDEQTVYTSCNSTDDGQVCQSNYGYSYPYAYYNAVPYAYSYAAYPSYYAASYPYAYGFARPFYGGFRGYGVGHHGYHRR